VAFIGVTAAVVAAGCGGGGGSASTGTSGATSQSSLETLVTFPSGSQNPVLGAMRDGTLYGIVNGVGPGGAGYAWSVPIAAPTVTDIGNFAGFDYPVSSPDVAVDSNGDVFVSTWTALYEISAGTRGLKTFTATIQGPFSNLVSDTQGAVWGAIGPAILYSDFVFKIAPGAVSAQTVANVGESAELGSIGVASVCIDSHGNLYGANVVGGSNGNGYVFELPAGQTSAADIGDFPSRPQSGPYGRIASDGNGNVFGTVFGGSNSGYLYVVRAGSKTVTDLIDFPNTQRVGLPGVVVDARGDAFAAVPTGGAHGYGAIFEVPAGAAHGTDIYDFDGKNGAYPVSLLTDAQGDVFGTTAGSYTVPPPLSNTPTVPTKPTFVTVATLFELTPR
jgi:hypothetical protein